MTLLASWVGVDTHGPTSAYIVSDSRITWNHTMHFDYGKKVFASKLYPEIFGYAGDVLFPSIVLSQILEMIDSNLLFDHGMSCSQKNKIVFEKLCYSFSKYPNAYGNNPIQILHISRDTCFEGYPDFFHSLMTWDRASGWQNCEKSIPASSDLIQVLGTGREEFLYNYFERYQSGTNKSTSRNVFHCFIDTLDNIKDQHCGGAPQLVGVYRKPFTSAQNFGILYENRRYFLGMELPKDASFERIEWRNELFERCNGVTKLRIAGAARQDNPLHR